MKYLNLKAIITTIFIASLFGICFNMTATANDPPIDLGLDNFNEDVSDWANDADAEPTGEEYILYEEWGGTWYDVEKLPPDDGVGNPVPVLPNEEDDLMCWAASCANILQWTGWGYVVHSTEGAMTNADEMFQHYLDHWTDVGYRSDWGWNWWFDGTETPDGSVVDVAGGGNFWPTYTFSTYSGTYDDPDSGVLSAIDGYLHDCMGVALSITWGPGTGHAITCWGINFDDSLDPTDEEYYIGIWVTDSDDHKHLANPPDMLRYYEVEYNNALGRWYILDLYGEDTAYIRRVYALAQFPNTAPIADANGPYSGFEGSPITFDGSGSSDPDGNPLQYRWDFNNDGTYDTLLSSDPTATYTYSDDYTGNVVLEVSDYIDTDTDTAFITVNNAPPVADANGPYSGFEGSPITFDGTGSYDPGMDDTLTYEWYYPDGTSSSGAVTSHTFGDNGVFYVTLEVTDDDGDSDTDQQTVTVNNIAPTITPLATYTEDENTAVTLSGTATDPGSDDLTFTWNWGDCTPDTVTIYYNNGVNPDPYPSPDIDPMDVTDIVSHTFGDNGVYTVSLTVTDDDGNSDVETTTVTVDNVAPTIASEIGMEWPYSGNEGFILPGIHNLEFSARATDPGSDDLTFTWNWYDGTSDTITTYFNNGVSPDPYPSPEINPMDKTDTVFHTYDSPGTYIITLTVGDDDGESVTANTFEVTVLDIEGGKHHINNYIQGLDEICFKDKANQRKNAFNNMFNALDNMLENEEYSEMIQHLNNNIREKCDGSLGGNEKNDWITDPVAQEHICAKIDDLTAYIATYL